jgi:ABC-type multidrug transport system ATPase subunit
MSDLLFLDEPTTNLDADATAWYHYQLKNVPSQSVIFIASNQPSEYPPEAEILNIMDYKEKEFTHWYLREPNHLNSWIKRLFWS